MLFPFSREGNRGTEKLRKFPKVTQLVGGSLGFDLEGGLLGLCSQPRTRWPLTQPAQPSVVSSGVRGKEA